MAEQEVELKMEIAMLHEACKAHVRTIDKLKAENKKLRSKAKAIKVKKLDEVFFTVEACQSENTQRTLENAMKIAKLVKTLHPSSSVKVKRTTVETVEEL